MKRNTVQRQVVLDAVRALHTHPTADEVLAEATRRLPGISRATIYNNLNQLVEEGLVTRVLCPGEPERFDFRTDRHAHFRCRVCGRIYDCDVPVDLASEPTSTDGFEVEGYEVYLFGICGECKEKGETDKGERTTKREAR